MRERRVRLGLFLFFVLIISTKLVGCSSGPGGTPTPLPHVVPVDPIFKEFYETLGGKQVLGPTIHVVEVRENNLKCQFTERVLMCFNPAVTGTGRFSLYPLGKDLDIHEDSHIAVKVAPPGARVVDGFVVYEKFLPLYDRLYGSTYVGYPLTELRVNHDLNRVEQFFSNVGFYQALGDPNGPVFLIPYGAYLCGGDCSSRLDEYWYTIKANLAEQPFAQSIARLGGSGIFGTPLLQPELTADGFIQQVYSNVIFYAPQNDISQVRLRPLARMLGYPEEPLVVKHSHDQLVFYHLENGLGHNVPKPFDQFIASHGGPDLAGRPLTEVKPVAGQNLYQQCFENYCLLYDPVASDPLKVRLAPLGKEYTQRIQYDPALEVKNLFTAEKISLTVSVDKPNQNSNEEQFVRMMVVQKENGQPIARVEGYLLLSFEDRAPVRYNFPPTDDTGMSVVVIPPHPGLKHGARLMYQVCLNLPSDQPICNLGSYLIWNIQ